MPEDFKIIGQEKLAKTLRLIALKAPKKGAAALFFEAEKIMRDSKRNFVPVAAGSVISARTGKKRVLASAGTLRASGIVQEPKIKGANISVTMGYGGAAAPYATAIHEHPSGASPPSWKGKKLNFHLGGDRTKFLEKPLMKAIPGLGARLAKAIDLKV